MKRLALALALISSTLLSGCIIVPAHRGYHGGYYHDHDRGYGDGYGRDQRGPR
ncbi:MAG: hypothetical protein HY020_07525 [Burkholderiales bacterium]|nr:hypothetical protein [Burkholderiales bacterium]